MKFLRFASDVVFLGTFVWLVAGGYLRLGLEPSHQQGCRADPAAIQSGAP